MVELDARDGVSQITRQKHGVHRHPTLKERGGKQGLGRDTQWVTSKQAEAPRSVSNLRVEGHRWLESSRPRGISEDLFLEAHVMHGGLW